MLFRFTKRLFPFAAALVCAAPLTFCQEIPENLGAGLRELVETYHALPAGSAEPQLRGKMLAVDPETGARTLVSSTRSRMIVDTRNRVLVTVLLDGTVPVAELRTHFSKLNITIVDQDSEYRGGIVSAYLPLASAIKLAKTPGVSSVKLSRRPVTHGGAVTSQGAALLHTDVLNAAGLTGQGITIGILSDSYDMVPDITTATIDVATGDLPNFGVADGRPGMKFLSDGPDPSVYGNADEGRGLAQIVYDLAPGAQLCFASAFFGEISYARNIRRLRTDSQCNADIIVDDIGYLGEPLFSPGIIEQAVADVATSTVLNGKPVIYVSAAGNSGVNGFGSDLRFVTDASARALTNQSVTLTGIPAAIDTRGGFHNFSTDSANPVISQLITITGANAGGGVDIILQWDDPFDVLPAAVSTDLNLLVFSSAGRYLNSLSAFDNNLKTNEPLEFAGTFGDGTYRLVLARTGTGTQQATKFRYYLDSSSANLTTENGGLSQPTIIGHSGSQYALSVGAYAYDSGTVPGKITPVLEAYSSAGPVTVALDPKGNRLGMPLLLQKPDISGPDCVSTTFFADPNANDPFYTFCGTSAAAPHVAAVVALLLQSAGGPGSLTLDRVRSKLQSSTQPRDIDKNFSQAALAGGGASVLLTATGDDSNASASSPNFFKLTFSSPNSGQTLNSVTIDLTGAGLNFDPDSKTGLPLTFGSKSPGVVVTSAAPTSRTSTLTLTFTGFTSGSSVTFGIDRDLATTNVGGNSADLVAGATVAATLSNGTNLTGIFANQFGTGYSPVDGFGLIDAAVAVKAP